MALAAIKFGFLKAEAGRAISFNLNDWLRLDGDTGPAYLELYRSGALRLSRAGLRAVPQVLELQTPVEKKLAYQLGKFNAAAVAAAQKYEPALVSAYLSALRPLLTAFYAEEASAPEASRASRLALTASATRVLGQALDLLGIEVSAFHADLPAPARAFTPRARQETKAAKEAKPSAKRAGRARGGK
jgi:arginyl-tRNA synthetase